MAAASVNWDTILADVLTNEGEDAEAAWQTVEFCLDHQRDYPVNQEIAERLFRAFDAVRKTPLFFRSLCCMMKLSMTHVDMINVEFVELVCDVFFTSKYGMPMDSVLDASTIHAWLTSEKFILEEIQGFPRYTEYVTHVQNMFNQEEQDANLRNRFHAIRNVFRDVPRSGRLTKRAVSGDCPDS